MICSIYERFHTFDVPAGDDGYGRRCACGELQVYRRPTGESAKFTDVLVEVEDLRSLLGWVDGPSYDPHGDFQHLMERIHAALGD